MNVIARLEYELAFYDSAVHRFNHYTTRTPLALTITPRGHPCKKVVSKVGDCSREWPKGSLFNSYYTEVLGRALLLSLVCSTLPLIRTLYCWVLSKEASSTIFKVFGMTQLGIEPMSPGPLANTLPTRPGKNYIFFQSLEEGPNAFAAEERTTTTALLKSCSWKKANSRVHPATRPKRTRVVGEFPKHCDKGNHSV